MLGYFAILLPQDRSLRFPLQAHDLAQGLNQLSGRCTKVPVIRIAF